jgi:hypothetical protein
MGSSVLDQPDHLAKVLAELEARKESLRSRLESLDTAINGLQGLQAASASSSSELEGLNKAEEMLANHLEDVPAASNAVEAQPLREQTAEVVPPVSVTSLHSEGSEHRGFVLKYDTTNSPAERPKALKRQLQVPPADRRKPNHLNVYVNRNTEWASRQFVAPHSPRAIFRHKTGHRCPKCGSQDTRLSLSRGIADCFMFLFDYSLARCRNCDTRFRIWRSREEDEDQHEADAHPATD